MDEPVRYEADSRTEYKGNKVRVRGRGDVGEQERAAAQVEPGLQEDTGAPPRGQAPVRVQIIVQYIDDVWGPNGGRPPILPSHPYDRALARFWAAYIDDKWYPSLGGIFRAQTDEAKAEAVSQVFAGLQLLEEAFEKCSNGKGFFGGEAIGYLDIALGCHLGWLKATEKLTGIDFLDEAKTPLLVGWAEHFCSDDAVKEVMPETDSLVEFANAIMARSKSAPPPAAK